MLSVFAAVVLADQITKAIIMAKIPEQGLFQINDPVRFFRFVHERNRGVVGGIFTHHRVMAYAAPLMASLVLVYLFRYLDPRSKLQTIAFGLIAGGAVGNYIDRLRLGSVTDFLQFNFYFLPDWVPWKYYPAFNVADSCICTGVFVLVVSWFIYGQKNVSNPS